MRLIKTRKIKIERTFALVSLIIPFLGFLYACRLFWERGISFIHGIVLLIFFVLTEIGIEVGFHRLFSHKSFKANDFVQWLLIILGSMAFQGPVVFWTGIHRLHHAYSDKVGDPHFPQKQKN